MNPYVEANDKLADMLRDVRRIYNKLNAIGCDKKISDGLRAILVAIENMPEFDDEGNTKD